MTTTTDRTFTVLPAGQYQFDVPDCLTTFEASRLHWENTYELKGDLTVRCRLPGAHTDNGTLSWGTFTFTSTTARHSLAKRLAVRAQTKDTEVNWDDLIESFCYRIRDAEQVGEPAVYLAQVPDPPPQNFYRIEQLRLPREAPSMLFGDGDSLKSMLALYIAGRLAQTGLAVGFFDWELNRSHQKWRYRQLFGDDMPPSLVYAECTRPIVVEIDRLSRMVATHQIEFAVFDSVVPACGSNPGEAETASRYSNAVRSIGGAAFTSLHIGHVTKADDGDMKPFGSVFWSNLFRQNFFVKADRGLPGDPITVGLYPRKHNLGPEGQAVGFAVSFREDGAHVWPTDLADSPELAGPLPLHQRMAVAVTAGPKTLAVLATELDAKLETIERTVRRKNGMFTKVTNHPDGVARIGLIERRPV